jgi:hypothetical protein
VSTHAHVWQPWRAADFNNLAVEWHADGNRILVVTSYCACGATYKSYTRLEGARR